MPPRSESSLVRRVQEVFDAVLDEPADRREARLVRLCDGEPVLEARVRRLLTHADRDLPLPRLPLDGPPATPDHVLGTAPGAPDDTDWPPGRRLGDYRIQERLWDRAYRLSHAAGRSDEEPAFLLVVRERGPATRQQIDHFERVRQQLEDRADPRLARPVEILFPSASQVGYVTGFVPGNLLHEHCRAPQVTLDEALDLYRQVCWTIHRLHRRGMVHGALRFDRILVAAAADRDGAPRPTILGCGLPDQLREGVPGPDKATDTRALGALLPEVCGERLHRSISLARSFRDHGAALGAAAAEMLGSLQDAAVGEVTGSPARDLVGRLRALADRHIEGHGPDARRFAVTLLRDCLRLIAELGPETHEDRAAIEATLQRSHGRA